jgi:aspartyl-tRNA(Asn)/glutamyl-tRNA(Gln) amidotransferase subunit A
MSRVMRRVTSTQRSTGDERLPNVRTVVIPLPRDATPGVEEGPMSTDSICWMSASDMAAAIRRKKLSPVQVVDAALSRIEKTATLNAYVLVDADGARKAAKAAERALTRKGAALGPLHGVPFSVKDLVITRGSRTTFGTPLYRDNVTTEDAPIVERLKAAGGIMIGKTNTPTFGWIGATHNLLFGATRNPWNLERTPGGSSGGASAAVAAGLAPLAVGTDGGGSIRIPASFAGIFGHKPSFGRIPIHPHGAAWSLSHVGPMTRTVKDAALMMNACAGPDERDQYSLPGERVDYVKALRGDLKGLRVAYSDSLGFAQVVDPDVRAATAKAARAFRELGARVEDVNPGWPSPFPAWKDIFCGGIAARMASFIDRRDEIDPGLFRIIEETLQQPPTRYVQAWFDRLAWWQHPRAFFEKYDLLLTPTTACAAFPVGLDNPAEIAGTPLPPYGWIPFTYPFNMTGQPAASVPCGFTHDGLPIGLQIVGRRLADAIVLRAAAGFESIRPWAQHRPPGV